MTRSEDVPAGALQAQLVNWRRHLHRHPEPSFQEFETAAYLEAELRQMPGLEVSRPTPTSVLGVLRGTRAGTGRTVLLRADIDALPIQEENTFEYASTKPGLMHACGHDGHAAILLGTAQSLALSREAWSGEVRFIFQHAEENSPGGAEELVTRTPLMDGVDVVTGLHLVSGLPAGEVHLKAGPLMAAPDTLDILIRGKGGHGAMPEEGVDPIAVGAQVVSNLQHVVSRNVSALDALVVSITQFHAGSAHNVIPDTAKLQGTVRAIDPAVRAKAPALIERVVRGVCAAHSAECDFAYEYGYRPVVNSPQVVERLRSVAERVVGPARVREARPWMAGEDFSAYLERAPGAYFFLGAGSDAADSRWPHHHPRFTIDESVLGTGAHMLHAAALELLRGA